MDRTERHAADAVDEIGGRYEIDEAWATEVVQRYMIKAIEDATSVWRLKSSARVWKAYAFENGLIAAFDSSGEQMPELQGHTFVELLNILLDLKERIKEIEEPTE